MEAAAWVGVGALGAILLVTFLLLIRIDAVADHLNRRIDAHADRVDRRIDRRIDALSARVDRTQVHQSERAASRWLTG